MKNHANKSRFWFNRQEVMAGILALLYIALMINWLSGQLRFVSPRPNFTCFAFGQLIPIGGLVHLVYSKSDWLKEAGCLLWLLAGFAGILFLGATLASLSDNAGSKLICSVPLGRLKVNAYRVSPGALDGFFVIVQQERTVFPGVV